MNNKTGIIGIVVLVLGLLALVLFTKEVPKRDGTSVIPSVEDKGDISMCYYNESVTANGLKDMAWVHMDISGKDVEGEARYMPAEKDSKVGKFAGQVGPVNKATMSRLADVWWDSMAEGVEVKEQLIISFGDGGAGIGFGEMVKSQDGVYVYKNPNELSFVQLSQIDCEYLDDKVVVESYIRANIKEIAPADAVLGGSWYTVYVLVNPVTKAGEFVFEDGHIQGKATFKYERSGDAIVLSEVVKI